MDHIVKGANHIWLPYTQMQNHLPQLEVVKSKGSEIFLKDGRILIDGIASWWSVAHGYNHPHIIKEMTLQLKTLPHVMLAGFSNEQTYKLAYRLCKFANMDYVFFSDSGSTAVEVAMKICWQFYINRGETKKTKFISFKNGYHGDTTGAMSLADLTSGMHQKFQNILLDNFCLKLPQNQNDLDEFENFIIKNKEVLAGIFIEPIVQCAGGMKFHEPKILRAIFAIAKKQEVLFIADECATGFYRTGKKFAVNHADIKPDIMILGKALTGGFVTLAATLVSAEIYNEFLGESLNKALMHGPTFMGNALACAAANASLDLFEGSNYAEKIKQDETFLQKEFKKLGKFGKTRVIGLVGVIEKEFSLEEIFQMRKSFISHGIFLRPFGNCIYLMPALNIKKSQLRKIIRSINEIF